MDGAAEAIARLIWFCFITPIKIGWFVVKFIGQFVFGVSKDLAQHKNAYGSLSQQAMPLVATTDSDEIYMRVVLSTSTKVIGGGFLGVDTTYNVLTAVYDFSPKAIREIRKKNLSNYVFMHSEPITAMDKEHAENGKKAWYVIGMLNAPTQHYYFKHYDDMVKAMDEVKENLRKLKGLVEHSSDKPLSEAFEA